MLEVEEAVIEDPNLLDLVSKYVQTRIQILANSSQNDEVKQRKLEVLLEKEREAIRAGKRVRV